MHLVAGAIWGVLITLASATEAVAAITYVSQTRWTSVRVNASGAAVWPPQFIEETAYEEASDYSPFVSDLAATVTSFGIDIGPVTAIAHQTSVLNSNGFHAYGFGQYFAPYDGNPYANFAEIHSYFAVDFVVSESTVFQATVSVGPSSTPILTDLAFSFVYLSYASPGPDYIDDTYQHPNPGTFANSTITLAPGTYRLVADLDLFRYYRGPNSGLLYWNVDFVAVPTPSTLLLFFAFLRPLVHRNRPLR